MIKHIVAFKVNQPGKPDDLKHLKKELDHLPDVIPGIVSFETGENISSSLSAYDLVLVSSFHGQGELDSYKNHPEHIKVLDLIKQIVADLVVVDYEI